MFFTRGSRRRRAQWLSPAPWEQQDRRGPGPRAELLLRRAPVRIDVGAHQQLPTATPCHCSDEDEPPLVPLPPLGSCSAAAGLSPLGPALG